MRQRFRAIFDGMTVNEQQALVGLILVVAVAVGVRNCQTRDQDGFKPVAKFDNETQKWVRVAEAQGVSGQTTLAGAARAALPAPARVVNVNTAGLAELETLPRIGAGLGQRIIDYRGQHGPFRSIDDLNGVAGIGPKTLDALRSRVTVGAADTSSETVAASGAALVASAMTLATANAAPTPAPVLAPLAAAPAANAPRRVNINTAGQQELEALPGVGPVTARKIIEYRMTHGPFRRLEELERVSGIGPVKLKDLAPLTRLSD